MKKILCIAAMLMIYIASFSQKVERITVKGPELLMFYDKNEYKYPEFTRSKVYFKNGDIASVRLNFDYFNQAIKFIDEKNDTLAIANESDLKYISVGIDSFFYDNGYYEWVATSATARLAIKHTFKLNDREKVGVFGIASPTRKVESHDAILENTTLQLGINEELTFIKQTAYYISGSNGHFAEANKKNLIKLFPKKDIENYIKENKVNLNKEADLVDLFVYANKPK